MLLSQTKSNALNSTGNGVIVTFAIAKGLKFTTGAPEIIVHAVKVPVVPPFPSSCQVEIPSCLATFKSGSALIAQLEAFQLNVTVRASVPASRLIIQYSQSLKFSNVCAKVFPYGI